MSIMLNQYFEIQHCCNCGVAFAIPLDLYNILRQTKRSFYCPNGHGQSFTAQTEAERLQKLLDQETACRLNEEALRETAERKLRRLQKRIHSGVCPCCQRSFDNLRSHMDTKHKDYGKALPPANLAVVKAS
jgi:hypothetical protein